MAIARDWSMILGCRDKMIIFPVTNVINHVITNTIYFITTHDEQYILVISNISIISNIWVIYK